MNSKYYTDFVIAVDFDETIAVAGDGYCILYPEAKDFINTLAGMGATITLWTCRTGDDLDNVVRWLNDNHIHIDYVNINTPQRSLHSPKILADIYVDDKAYVDNYIDWKKLKQYAIYKLQKHFDKLKQLGER